jgi:hypothetical protein
MCRCRHQDELRATALPLEVLVVDSLVWNWQCGKQHSISSPQRPASGALSRPAVARAVAARAAESSTAVPGYYLYSTVDQLYAH